MTPWQIADVSETSHQRALFAWANCAAEFGFAAATMPEAYSLKERARIQLLRVDPVPELALLFAIHNQGHGDRIRGAQAKAEGVKAGVPDMMLPVPMQTTGVQQLNQRYWHGLFIELKKRKKGVVREVQSEWGENLSRQGYAWSLCKGWIEAANTIAGYLGSTVRIDDNPV